MYSPVILSFIVIFAAFIIIGFLRREFHVLLYLTITYLIAIAIFIILESIAITNYAVEASVMQYILLPPLGILLGYGVREFVGRARDGGDYQGSIVVVRKLMPIIYIVYLLYTALLIIPALALSILLFIIEWYEFRSDRFGLALTILNTLVLIFMPMIIAAPSSIVMALALDTELQRRLHNPWLVTLTYVFSASLAYPLLGLYRALIILIPIAT